MAVFLPADLRQRSDRTAGNPGIYIHYDRATFITGVAFLPIAAPGLVSSPGEFHPEEFAEPYINVSVHTAPIIQPGKESRDANARTARVGSKLPARASVWHAVSNVPFPCISI